MKKAIGIIILLTVGIQIFAQLGDNCIPQKLIVAAENLNFRNQPNTNSEPLDKLNNSELLTFLDIHRTKEKDNWTQFSNSWIKVKRDLTGEEGYVFGQYINPQEIAYYNYQDAGKLQDGNWYGIYQEGNEVKLEKTNPKVEELDDGFPSIISDNKHKLIICSQEELTEGKINGQLNLYQDEYLSIGKLFRLIRIGDFEFSLACTGMVNLDKGWLTRENEKIIFQIKGFKSQGRFYSQQDLSDCILQYGEVGYSILFAGDLNNDGFPELIISEATTHGGTLYYFKSSKDGKLELQSTTGSSSRC